MSEIKTNKTSGAGVTLWLGALGTVLGAVIGYSAHFLTTVALLSFVVRLWMPSLWLESLGFLVTVFLALYTIVPLFIMVAPDDRLTGKRVLLTVVRHLKLCALVLTVLVVATVVAALYGAPDKLHPLNNNWIYLLILHWVSVLLIEVLRRNPLGMAKLPGNPPNKTDQSDSDSDDEAGAK